jgi:hypothetical protein
MPGGLLGACFDLKDCAKFVLSTQLTVKLVYWSHCVAPSNIRIRSQARLCLIFHFFCQQRSE